MWPDEIGLALAAQTGAHYLHCDVGDKAQVDATISQALNQLGRIDAREQRGIFKSADFLDISEADFDAVLRVNLKGAFLMGQACARVMANNSLRGDCARWPGVIVNMSSVNGALAIANIASYNVSKGGINQLTRAMALALADLKIPRQRDGPRHHCHRTGCAGGADQ